MKELIFIFIFIGVLAVGFNYWNNKNGSTIEATIDSFDACVSRGLQIVDNFYPKQCKTPDGKVFVEDIGNAIEKQNLIVITDPSPNSLVSSPMKIKGEARGTWFFEGSFPIKIFDEDGTQLGTAVAKALSSWTTENPVPFEATITFSSPKGAKGRLVLEKDNPSGLPENADSLYIPVRFKN